MKIVVVEPHPDDAFLSLGWHLETLWRDHERMIITVFADEKRGKEAERYAAEIGASHYCLGLPESNMNSPTEKGVKPIPELKELLKNDGIVDADLFLFPLGLQHPDHIRTAVSRPANALRYLDTPYQTKQKLGNELRRKCEGMEIYSLAFPSKKKWKHAELFKTQAKFFYFNKDLLIGDLPEIILCRTSPVE